MCVCVCLCVCVCDSHYHYTAQNVRKKRHELQKAYDASKTVGIRQEDKIPSEEHTPLHSHSAVQLHSLPTAHSKPGALKSVSTTELAAGGKKSVTMTKAPPAVSSTGLRSHGPLQLKENDQISINKVYFIFYFV